MRNVDRGVNIDLSEEEIVTFLRSRNPSYTQPVDADYLTAKGLVDKGTRAVPTQFSNTGVTSYLLKKKNYDLFKLTNGSRKKIYLNKVSSVVIVIQSLIVRYHANIFVKATLDLSKTGLIVRAFNAFNPANDGDIEAYITANAAKNGIGETDFELIFRFELLKDGNPTINDIQDKQLHDLYNAEKYYLLLISEEWIDGIPTPPKDNVIVIPPGGDPIPKIDDLIKREKERLAGQGCSATKTFTKKIYTLPIPTMVEFMLKTECHWEQNDCWKVRVCLEKPYMRETFTTIFATMIYSVDQDGIINILEHCVTQSALAAAVIGIITENFPAALAAFKVLTLECIKEHALEEFECMVPDLFLVDEVKDWHPV
ncbi:hypothetical protein ACU8MT_15570 [Rhizobium leguminosarum]